MCNFRLITLCIVAALAVASLARTTVAQDRVKEVPVGGNVEIAVVANDPDGDPLTYTWTTTGGRIVGAGPRVLFDASDVPPGIYRATVTVSDAICEASTTIEVNVLAPVAASSVVASIGACAFARGSARASNACKATLDDVVLRLAQDASATIVVVGSAGSSERFDVALKRAEAARDYLVNERSTDPSRILTRAHGLSCPDSGSGGIVVYFVPSGIDAASVRTSCP
jgi:outer membrane protein OmpA-like peptidoglycan-associated protein